jgi:RNA polymerase primary sigma factor
VGVHDVAGEEAGLEEMHASLVKGIAENFWAAMLPRPGESPLLEASVTALRDGAVVVAEKRVEPDAVDEATRTRVRALRAHYEGTTVTSLASTTDVVRTSVPLRLVPSRNGVDHPASSVIEHEAVMLVATTGDEDDAPNRLVAMRGNRMVVLTRRLTDVPIGMRVQGVLLAGTAAIPHGEDDPVAEAAEAFLRACEPPEHDDWTRTDDVVATYERGAATRIREFRAAMMSAVGEVLKRPLPADDKGPSALRDLLTIDLPSKKRTTGRPTVRHVSGEVNGDGAWTVRVEMELPRRADPWVIAPTLRFATRSGPKPTVGWARFIAESGCTVTHDGLLRVDAGVPIATFSGVSDVDGHPVQADDSVLEVDLTGAKEVAG